jgi:uncharacterized membrane protein
MGAPPDLLGQLLWNLGFSLCHQLPERSLSIAGYQLPMCARDTGTFIGFLAVMIALLLLGRLKRAGMPDRTMLAVAVAGFALYLLDASSSYVGIRDTTNGLRLFVGLAMGSGIALLIFTVLAKFAFNVESERPLAEWKDIPVIYGPVALAGLFIYFAPPYLPLYYLVSLLTIVGYLSLVLVATTSLIALVRDKTPYSRRKVARMTIGAAMIEIAFVVVLWLAHFLTTSTPFI